MHNLIDSSPGCRKERDNHEYSIIRFAIRVVHWFLHDTHNSHSWLYYPLGFGWLSCNCTLVSSKETWSVSLEKVSCRDEERNDKRTRQEVILDVVASIFYPELLVAVRDIFLSNYVTKKYFIKYCIFTRIARKSFKKQQKALKNYKKAYKKYKKT